MKLQAHEVSMKAVSYMLIPEIQYVQTHIFRLPPTVSEFIELACEYFQMPREKLIQKNRKRDFVFARHCVMFVIYTNKRVNYSLETIGKAMNLDHATVLHGIRTIKSQIDIRSIEGSKAIQFQEFINQKINNNGKNQTN